MQRKEIMALETMLQIGVDEKVKYNRICLYIKVDNLVGASYICMEELGGPEVVYSTNTDKGYFEMLNNTLSNYYEVDLAQLLDQETNMDGI